MKKLFAILVAFALILFLPSAMAEGKTYGDPIIFGLTTPVTGPQAAGGLQAANGLKLKVEEINAAGGIELSDGWHLIEVRTEDDQGDATLCDTTVRKLVSESAAVIFGPYFSGMTLALDGTMRELGVPLVNSATSIRIPELENPWIWRCRCDDGLNVLILGKAVIDDYTAKFGSTEGLLVGIICNNDETGTSAASSYKAFFEERGIAYYEDYHNKDDADLTAYIQKAVGAGVNAWVSSTHDIAAAALAKAMYEAGLRDQIVYMNPILAQAQVLELMEPEWVEGWGCVSDYAASDPRPAQAAFTQAWYAAYGMNVTPDVQGALYYSHATVAIEAIRNADSANPADIRDAIAALYGLDTIVGTVYASEYTNLLYEISVTKIVDLVPSIVGSLSMAADYGFGN